MIPTKEEKEEMRQRKLHGSDDESDNGSPVGKVVYEMQPPKMQQQYEMPFTPRTQAFNALERKLPLRG